MVISHPREFEGMQFKKKYSKNLDPGRAQILKKNYTFKLKIKLCLILFLLLLESSHEVIDHNHSNENKGKVVNHMHTSVHVDLHTYTHR